MIADTFTQRGVLGGVLVVVRRSGPTFCCDKVVSPSIILDVPCIYYGVSWINFNNQSAGFVRL